MPRPRRVLHADGAVLRAGFAAIRQEFDVAVDFPPGALAEAQDAPDTAADRRDLTALPFVTLDPPGTRDLDQAMHLERSRTGWRVRYAIADVGSLVVPGGALDAATHDRALTVYCPDGRVPLHPPVLEQRGSLLPGKVRPAVVWDLQLDREGEVTDASVQRATVRSRAQLDYPAAQRRLDAGVPPDDVLSLLAEIGAARARLEARRGGVSLGRPEQDVVAVEDGWTLVYRAPLPIEDHNARISLMTGMVAAQMMLAAGAGVLRTMPPAREEDVARLRRQAVALEVPWPEGWTYGEVLAGLDHADPGTAAFLASAVTLFRGAAWRPFVAEPPAEHHHAAIAAPYAHVTAPLRRLVDRYGLEVCLADGAEPPEWVLAGLETVGTDMARGARRTAAVDRACTDLVEAAVLARHVGEDFDAVTIDRRTVQLRHPAVVARTEDDDLPVGTHVRVRVAAADPDERLLRLTRVE